MNTKDYQNGIFDILIEIFGEKYVKKEWDSVKYDSHTSNHKQIYAPRLDIAVGPFNSYAELDTGRDSTEVMKEHPFTKRIVEEIAWDSEDFDKCWNNFSRCYLAIEIELGSNKKTSNSLKHVLGSIVNASVSGSIGIVITDNKIISCIKTTGYISFPTAIIIKVTIFNYSGVVLISFYAPIAIIV